MNPPLCRAILSAVGQQCVARLLLTMTVLLSSFIAAAGEASTEFDAGGVHPQPTDSSVADESQSAGAIDTGASALHWQRRSPDGADIADIAYSPRQAGLMLAAGYVSSSGGGGALYRSLDGGARWQTVPGFDGRAVYAAEFADSGAAFVGSQDGVFFSAAGASRWTSRDLGIGAHDAVLDIAIDPSRTSVIWVGVSDALGRQRKTLLRSADGGLSWSDRTPAMAIAMGCREIAFDPLQPQRMAAVFAGDFGGGMLWLSVDGGETWTDRSAGLGNRPLRSVAFARGRILVGGGQLLGQQYLGLLASDDEGRSWRSVHDPNWQTAVVHAIAVSPIDPDHLLIGTDGDGVHVSADGGRSWRRDATSTPALSIGALRFNPDQNEQIAAASVGGGVLLSDDGGRQFAPRAQGMQAVDVRALAIDPNNPKRIAIAANGLNEGRIFSSSDSGRNWQRESLPATRYNALQFSSDGSLYAASGGPSTVAAEGIYRRDDDGSWSALGPEQGPLFETQIRAIRFSAEAPDLIMLAGSDYGAIQGYEGVIWRSVDRGTRWTKAYESAGRGEFIDLEVLPTRTDASTPETMLAAWEDGNGARRGDVLRSDDGGRSWQPSAAGLPVVLSNARLCVSANDPGVVYLSAGLGNWSSRIFRSVDAGRSWQARGSEGAWILDIGCDPDQSDRLYVVRAGSASQPSRIEYSEDGGNRFTPADAGLPSVRAATQLLITANAAGGSDLMLATGQGAFMAQTGGAIDVEQ